MNNPQKRKYERFAVGTTFSYRSGIFVDDGKQNGHLPSKHERGWFYPLLAVAGASSFVQMLYGETLTVALVRGIAMFSAFFLGYMISPALASSVVRRLRTEKSESVTESDLKILTMFVYSIGVIVAIVQNLLPTPMMPLYIFVVYLLFVLSKCAEIFGADTDEKKIWFVFGVFLALALVPIVVVIVIMKFNPQDVI